MNKITQTLKTTATLFSFLALCTFTQSSYAQTDTEDDDVFDNVDIVDYNHTITDVVESGGKDLLTDAHSDCLQTYVVDNGNNVVVSINYSLAITAYNSYR
jgi:hypothetical protein